MGKTSLISWTDATWNVAVGCSKVDKDCLFCYMYRQSLNGTRYTPDQVIKTKKVFTLPLRIKEPSKIFTSSLTDFFHEDIDSFRGEAWDIIRKCPQHTFQILTKRPERILHHLPDDWGDGWDNVWLGTSVGSKKGMQRIAELLMVPAKVHFASIEPLYEQIDLSITVEHSNGIAYITRPLTGIESEWVPSGDLNGNYDHGSKQGNKLSWVIVGGESGNDNGKYKYRPCYVDWIEKIVSQCKQNKIPVFVKQLGTHLGKLYNLKDRHGTDMEEWPESLNHLKIREFPLIIESV